MIQSQYGWSDDEVLNMTIGRLRQVAQAISARLRVESLERRMLVEWQTKALASYLAALSQSEEGARALFNNIKNLSLTGEVSEEEQPEPASMDRIRMLMGGVLQSG